MSKRLTKMEGQNNGGNRERNVVVPSQDPLKIQVILDNVFRKLGFEEMENVRSVSRMWRDNAIQPWRNHMAVFNMNKTTERYLKLSVNSNSTNKLYLVQEKPFKQYKLTKPRGFHYFPPALPAAENSLYFWNNCGPILTYLNIEYVALFESNMYFEGLKWILNCCHNLETLKFSPYKIRKQVGERRIMNPVVPANAVTAAAAETVVARKLKFLSISSVDRNHRKQRWHKELFEYDPLLARRFFNLIPNLQGLELDLNYSVIDVVEGLKRLTLGLMSLEKLFIRRPWIQEDITWLLTYIRELGSAQKLKTLSVAVAFDSLWDCPSRLKNILKSIRARVEEFELEVVTLWSSDPRESIRSIDLFRFNFSHLKSLTIKFKNGLNGPFYEARGLTGVKGLRYLAFDFSVLKGTSNLEYFFYGCRPYDPAQRLTSTLTAADLEGNERYPNWRLDENGIERVDDEEAANNVEVEGGDENVFAPEEGETVLKKMKEFHFEGCFNIEALHALGRMMPYLKTLETILDSVTLSEVLKVWGGNGDMLKNVKVLLPQGSHEVTKFITRKKKEVPQINIVKAVGEVNW